ncbi:MAG: hypothetical protein ABC596_05060 [Candidatus Methanosuratincola petrocarbonis]
MSTYDLLHKFEAEASQIVRYVYFRSLPRAEQDLSVLKNKLNGTGELGRGFYDAIRGIYNCARERDLASLYIKLYRKGTAQEISALSDRFRNEAYRPTIDDYERGFLIAWEIAAKTLAFLKENYPEYPLNSEPQEKKKQQEAGDDAFVVAPRKKAREERKGREG